MAWEEKECCLNKCETVPGKVLWAFNRESIVALRVYAPRGLRDRGSHSQRL